MGERRRQGEEKTEGGADGGRKNRERERRKQRHRDAQMDGDKESERVSESYSWKEEQKGRRQTSGVLAPPARTQLEGQEIGYASAMELKPIPPGLHQPTCHAPVLGMRKYPDLPEV